jgi:hypothetical protein
LLRVMIHRLSLGKAAPKRATCRPIAGVHRARAQVSTPSTIRKSRSAALPRAASAAW